MKIGGLNNKKFRNTNISNFKILVIDNNSKDRTLYI